MATTPNLGLPLYDESDTAELDTLLNGHAVVLDTNLQVALRKKGTYQVGTNDERLGIDETALFDGLYFYATDTRTVWRYNGTGWVSQDTGWIDLESANGFDFSGTPERAQVRRIDKTVYYRGGFTRKSGNFSSTYEDIGYLPLGFRPGHLSRTGAAAAGGRAGLIQFNYDGRILGSVNVGGSNWVETIASWPVD